MRSSPARTDRQSDYAQEHRPLTLGWIGTGPEHLSNLKILASVLTKLARQTTVPFKFVLIGALKNQKVYELFQSIHDLDVEFIDSLDWVDPESVPREIQKFDIGVLPHRSDGEWNRNKTSLKNLEYMACGVATICSMFGEMPYVITDGVNGYLASSDEEWIEKLKNLLADKELRAKLGRAGQENVHKNYSYEAMIPRLIDLFNSVSGSTIP